MKSRWYLQRGIAIVGGEDAIRRADWYGAPVFLYPTPAEWRRQRDRGNLQAACILDPDADFEHILSEAPYVYADAGLKQAIDTLQRRKLLQRALPLHVLAVIPNEVQLMVEAFKAEVRRDAA